MKEIYSFVMTLAMFRFININHRNFCKPEMIGPHITEDKMEETSWMLYDDVMECTHFSRYWTFVQRITDYLPVRRELTPLQI